MNVVYETPNKEYQIREQFSEEWEIVFGERFYVYNICKRFDSLVEWNRKNPKARLSDYVILRSEEDLKEAFKWLKSKNVISNDELNLQIQKIGK